MLLGKQNIYLYKPNHGNNYIGLDSSGLKHKWGSDSLELKQQYGSWRMNYRPVNGKEEIIKTECKDVNNTN
jgi:hypothetical protein